MGSLTDALTTGGKRVRTHDAQVVFKLPSTAKALVETIAAKREVDASVVYREALAEYLDKRGYRQ